MIQSTVTSRVTLFTATQAGIYAITAKCTAGLQYEIMVVSSGGPLIVATGGGQPAVSAVVYLPVGGTVDARSGGSSATAQVALVRLGDELTA